MKYRCSICQIEFNTNYFYKHIVSCKDWALAQCEEDGCKSKKLYTKEQVDEHTAKMHKVQTLLTLQEQKDKVSAEKTNPNKRKVPVQLLDEIEAKVRKLDDEKRSLETKIEKMDHLQKENERLEETNVQLLQKLEECKGETQKKQDQCEKLEMDLDKQKRILAKITKAYERNVKDYDKLLATTDTDTPTLRQISFLKASGQSTLYKADMILPNTSTAGMFCVKHLKSGAIRKDEVHIQTQLNDLPCVRKCYFNVSLPIISRAAMIFDFYEGSLREMNDTRHKSYHLHSKLFHRSIRAALQGLQAIHERNIIHLDIKPHNFFYNFRNKKSDGSNANKHKEPDDIQIFVGDFGLSVAIEEGGKIQNDKLIRLADAGMGTEFYRAPETYSGKACKASDIYSFGMMILMMLTFDHKIENVLRILRKTQYREVKVRSHVPSADSEMRRSCASSRVEQILKTGDRVSGNERVIVEKPEKPAQHAAEELFSENFMPAYEVKGLYETEETTKRRNINQSEQHVGRFATHMKSMVTAMLNEEPIHRPTIDTVLAHIDKFESS